MGSAMLPAVVVCCLIPYVYMSFLTAFPTLFEGVASVRIPQ